MNGLYEVSNYGNVRSLKWNKARILRKGIQTSGYAYVCLCKNRQIKLMTIHKLVATTFLENPNNYAEINHKDENKLNNNVNNLEWCSHFYNMNYGNNVQKRSKSNKKPIKQFDKLSNFIKEWDSAIDVQSKTGINQASIIKCCKNKLKTAGGFVWRYVNEL